MKAGMLKVAWPMERPLASKIMQAASQASRTPTEKAVRTMEIGYGGDPLVPEMDPYASRLQKSVDEIVEHKDDFKQQCDSILG